MPVAVFSHPDAAGHRTGPHHPESPRRMDAAAIGVAGIEGLVRLDAPPATRGQLLRAHPASHVDRLLALDAAGGTTAIDGDTVLGPGSLVAATRAAGGACAAVDRVMAGPDRAAFVAMRPPGHHAEPDRAMGFSLLSTAAIAALHARAAHGLTRVAVADFDVHHGNGTQAVLAGVPGTLVVSSHQSPCYPGTGLASEGNAVNLTLPPGSGGAAFRRGWDDMLIPALRRFGPELLVVSAGFDAHRADPLAELMLDVEDFAWITDRLVAVANECADGRIVSVLEGGYDLDALADCVAPHAAGLRKAVAPGRRSP